MKDFSTRLDTMDALKSVVDKGRWIDSSDLVTSMQRAILLRLANSFVYFSDDPSSVKELGEFMVCVLLRQPYQTTFLPIRELVVTAAQMVSRDWQERQNLQVVFLTMGKE